MYKNLKNYKNKLKFLNRPTNGKFSVRLWIGAPEVPRLIAPPVWLPVSCKPHIMALPVVDSLGCKNLHCEYPHFGTNK